MTTNDTDAMQATDLPQPPPPATLRDAMARINTTPEKAFALAVNAKWGFSGDDGDCPYEYDQGDTLLINYDTLYDLADAAIQAITFARRLELGRATAEDERIDP